MKMFSSVYLYIAFAAGIVVSLSGFTLAAVVILNLPNGGSL